MDDKEVGRWWAELHRIICTPRDVVTETIALCGIDLIRKLVEEREKKYLAAYENKYLAAYGVAIGGEARRWALKDFAIDPKTWPTRHGADEQRES